MPDAELPDDYYTSVDRLEDEMEGQIMSTADVEKQHFMCDFCARGVPWSSQQRVGHYLADGVCHNNNDRARQVNATRKLTQLATYCEDCTYRLLYLPCDGFTEVRALFTTEPVEDGYGGRMTDVEVTDVSPADDGIPWRPDNITQRVFGVGVSEVLTNNPDVNLMGPENIATVFMSFGAGIDIRQMVNPDGTFDADGVSRARRKYEKFAQKMAVGEMERTTFRDLVAGNEEV